MNEWRMNINCTPHKWKIKTRDSSKNGATARDVCERHFSRQLKEGLLHILQ
jgi:hypothetical protein